MRIRRNTKRCIIRMFPYYRRADELCSKKKLSIRKTSSSGCVHRSATVMWKCVCSVKCAKPSLYIHMQNTARQSKYSPGKSRHLLCDVLNVWTPLLYNSCGCLPVYASLSAAAIVHTLLNDHAEPQPWLCNDLLYIWPRNIHEARFERVRSSERER